MKRNFPKVELTQEQVSFLNEYEPEDDMFTSNEEVELVSQALNLENSGEYYLNAIRNTVVEFYSDLCEKIHEETGKFANNKWTAMQSVTAVIDNSKFIHAWAV